MKTKIIHITSIILMLVLIIVSTGHLTNIFINDTTPKRVESLYAQPENSIDVLCVGSSRIYCNIAPDVLWREYGISAYNLATSAQPLNLTYYAIKEALKTQNPKVVVIDVSVVLPKDQPNDQLETMNLQTGMKYSVNQMEALTDHADKDHFMEYLLRFPCFHNNYSDLTKKSFENTKYFQFPITGAAGFKGYINDDFDYHPEVFPTELAYTEDPDAEERYAALEKINNLCVENGTQLLMILTPSVNYMEFEAAQRFAADYQVPYINFMTLLNEIGINGEGDMVDEVHCNYYGASKVSRYLAQYVMNNFGVVSHAGEAGYESWDEYSQYMQLAQNDYLLSKETGLGNYFNYIPNENYVIITSLRGDYNTRDVGQRSVLTKLGCNDAAYEAGGTWMLDGSALAFYYTPADEVCDWSEDMYGTTFRITNEDKDEKSDPDIYIDGTKITIRDEGGNKIEDGLQFIVYNKLSHEIADAVIFDSLNDYRIVRYTQE